MATRHMTFHEALETIESLPEDQQENLIDIVPRRLLAQRREQLASTISEAKNVYAQGAAKSGTVKDLMGKIAE